VGIGAGIMAYRMGLGGLNAPGPGFFPFWLSFFLVSISILHLLGQLGEDTAPISLWSGRSWRKPALAAAIMLVYALILGWVGFFPATFLLFVSWLIMEREKPLVITLVATLGTACVYLLFTMLLQVQLPVGRLFR